MQSKREWELRIKNTLDRIKLNLLKEVCMSRFNFLGIVMAIPFVYGPEYN